MVVARGWAAAGGNCLGHMEGKMKKIWWWMVMWSHNNVNSLNANELMPLYTQNWLKILNFFTYILVVVI